jgi:putative chitinase
MKERLRKFPRHWIGLVILIVSLMPASYALARTSAPATTFESPPPGVLGYHTVRAGENLYCIGRAYGVDPFAIASHNGILNPNLISVGMVLAIPNAPKTLPPGRVCARQFNGTPPSPGGCRWNHTVVYGENLYRISLHYGVSMYAIAQANGISNLNLIYAGQTLCIP